MKTGKVFLVGAGPGDIQLITVKGLETIKQAEVILYDRLANPKLLEYAPRDCELIYSGKLPDRHYMRQENINDVLVAKALEGKLVVRLKGGDPGVFGRVGEEAQALAQHQIPFEIVPGITSGMAASLYAGIPVTHREYAESFAVVTAHDKSADGKPLLDWEALARGVDTIAFYMGVGNLPFICENLIKYGKPSSASVILIQWGTFGRQKTIQGTLETIVSLAEEAKFSNPSIILVGEVISLREKISWFEKKPLFGRQILLARTSSGPSELAKTLMEQGADVIEFPKWKKTILPINPVNITAYDQIVFTQPESVAEFFDEMFKSQLDVRMIKAEFFGASSKTIRALNKRGFSARLIDDKPPLEKVLIVGDKGSLTTNPMQGDYLVTSRNEIDHRFFPIFKRMIHEADLNTMIFPSSRAVELFIEGIKDCGLEVSELLRNLQVVCMGEQTQKAVMQAGLRVDGLPEKPNADALLDYLTGLPKAPEV